MVSTYAEITRPRNPISPPASARGDSLDADWLDPLAPAATTVRLRRNAEIVAQGQVTGYCYGILSGCVRTAILLEDGRRQIGEFLFAGDLLGYETTGAHPFAASAVSNVTLRRFHRDTIDLYAARDPAFDRQLHQYLGSQLQAMRARLAVMGWGSAAERIMSFLREMQARLSRDGAPSFELPMKLTDIADHLGLALETVCRGMAELRRVGAITTRHAAIEIHATARPSAAATAVLH